MTIEELEKLIKQKINSHEFKNSRKKSFIANYHYGSFLNDRISKSKTRWSIMTFIINALMPMTDEEVFKENEKWDISPIIASKELIEPKIKKQIQNSKIYDLEKEIKSILEKEK